MRFGIDAQLPPILCHWLREWGHEAVHVADAGLVGAGDTDIAKWVEGEGLVLITKDEDFVTLRLPDRFALAWLRCGNASNVRLRAWLDPRWKQIEMLFQGGDRFVEVW